MDSLTGNGRFDLMTTGDHYVRLLPDVVCFKTGQGVAVRSGVGVTLLSGDDTLSVALFVSRPS